MPNDETGLSLFDEAASAAGSFPVAIRGYDRSAVDDYVRSLESTVVNSRRRIYILEERINTLRDELDVANATVRGEDVDYTNLGGRASDILRLAEEQARGVVDQATVDAERIRETARREADTARLNAERDANETKSSGLAEIKRLRAQGVQDAKEQLEKATTQGEAIIAAARREAESLHREADQQAQTLRQTAYLDTETQRRAVETEVAEIRQQVAAEREQAIAHLRRIHEDAVATTSALLAEATQHSAESRNRLEAEVTDAARIRAEALAEAEQVRVAAVQETAERIEIAKKQAAAITERTQQEFAWRKQQLRRETDLLHQRKQAVLNQLASLSALAEQTAHSFPELEDLDDFEPENGQDKTVQSAAELPAQPQQSADDQAAQPTETVASEPVDPYDHDTVVFRPPAVGDNDSDVDTTVRAPQT